MLVAICPVCGSPMPAVWPGPKHLPRRYCSSHCRSKGSLLVRLERERAEMDEVVVLRLMKGDPVEASQAERMEAALRLSRQVDTGMNRAGTYRMGRWGNVLGPKPGALMSITEISKRIGRSPSVTSRYLRDMAQPERMLTVTEALAIAEAKIKLRFAPVLARSTAVGWDIKRSA